MTIDVSNGNGAAFVSYERNTYSAVRVVRLADGTVRVRVVNRDTVS